MRRYVNSERYYSETPDQSAYALGGLGRDMEIGTIDLGVIPTQVSNTCIYPETLKDVPGIEYIDCSTSVWDNARAQES